MPVQGAGDTQKLNLNQNLVFVGIGNTLAGDDGVGPVMLGMLQEALEGVAGISFHLVAGDLYALWDLLPETRAMVILDAVTGNEPGTVYADQPMPRGFTPSFHQTDAATVMKKLERLYQGNFPQWTVWGVSISIPDTLGEGLSPPVRAGADEAVWEILDALAGDGLKVGDDRFVLTDGGARIVSHIPENPDPHP
jgi:hydrogenase maturation protease